MGELFQVVDVVFVSLEVQTEIHAGQLIKLPHVDVVAEIVTS